MPHDRTRLSTGLPGLDRVLKDLLPGDNVVWQVDDIADYKAFVEPYCRAACAQGKRVLYLQFARHAPLVQGATGVEVVQLHPEAGFETFIDEVRQTIRTTGRGAFYVFDCLSDLAVDWYSDQMLGNFFMLTCPYLFDMETVAYFAILRNNHSLHAMQAVADTTQVLLTVFRQKDELYLHPLKVQYRHSPTMHRLHVWQGEEFVPVAQSATISEVQTAVPWLQLDSMNYRLGVWNRTFLEAIKVTDLATCGQCEPEQVADLTRRLLRMVVSRDERMLRLAEKHLSLPDLLQIGSRMIGTGLIGGKSVGMLLARAILCHSDPRWQELLEPHDSFYIGSDVFYTYLVQNGIWWAREKQRDPAAFLDGADMARQRMLTGVFPDYIVKQFAQMLEYFGQCPIIVRSSSLLEDSFGNAFPGKYDSVFCVNQGPRQQRLDDFMAAVRSIYASAMSDRALAYRAQRGLLDQDEQMALLVQRVSGTMRGDLFFPDVAGVGLSFNPYRWSEQIDPRAGVLRLVFGLGTRAVNRTDDDYTRIVALNAPQRRPEADLRQVRRYAQRWVDCLDLEASRLASYPLPQVVERSGDAPLELVASQDEEALRRAAEVGASAPFPWVLTFDRLLTDTPYVSDMRALLQTLEQAYDYPVDVEFTTNFLQDGSYKINLVQCRPLQVKGGGAIHEPPDDIPAERLLLRARRAVIGHSTETAIDRIIYVVPSAYSKLTIPERHQVARLIGQLTRQSVAEASLATMLIGPGRWGTRTPELGVPVSFEDIGGATAICEVVAMREDLVPDVSLGTHFLNELIETDMLYIALVPDEDDSFLNVGLLERAPAQELDFPDPSRRWEEVVRVLDTARLAPGHCVALNANVLAQRAVCYVQ